MNDEDPNGIILPESNEQPVIENTAFYDMSPFYMRRVEDYLASKYLQPDNFNRYHAVWSIKKASMLGIGLEIESQEILSRSELLDRVAADIGRIQWKPKRAMGSPRRIERPGIGDQYQQDLRSEYT
jgi:hypothetical protein